MLAGLMRSSCVAVCLTLACAATLGHAAVAHAASSNATDSTAPSVPYTWHNVTVGGGGFSPGILFSPAARDLAYLRTDIGGIYRWDQAARTWIPLQDDFPEGNFLGVESIALDRHDPDVIYAAVGMYHSAPAAIIASTDRGRTWSIHPVPFRMGGNEPGRGVGERLSIDPTDADILYFGSRYDGLQRSSDRGVSWTKVATFPYTGLGAGAQGVSGSGVSTLGSSHTGLSFVVFDPRSGHLGTPTKTILVGVADPDTPHLFRSNDAGSTWQAVPNQPSSELLPVQARIDDHGTLYITYSNSAGPTGATNGAVYRLNLDTDRWTDITPDHSVPTGYMGLSIAPNQPEDTVVVATLNRHDTGDILWRSSDGGKTWQNLRDISTRDVSAAPFLTWGDSQVSFGWWMAGVAIDPFDPSHVAYTTGATVYATHLDDPAGPDTWRPWVKGIEETAIITLTSPTSGPNLYSGFGDIGGYAHENLQASPPMFSHPAFNNTNNVEYAGRDPRIVVRSGIRRENNRDAGAALASSDDYGRTWQPLTLPYRGPASIITSADGSTFIVMTPAPLLSRDRGKSWTSPRDLPPLARVIADRQDPRRFYALDFEKATLWSSDDSGVTFKPLTANGLPRNLRADEPPDPEVPVPLLAVPGQPGDLWLISQGRLFHSLDGGSNFQAVPNDLWIARLSFGKAAKGHHYPALYAIGSRGELLAIWRSDDRGRTWIRVNDSKHEYGRRFRCISGDMRIYGRVYVGTDGRGIVYGDTTG